MQGSRQYLNGQRGMGWLMILFIIILILVMLLIFDQAYIAGKTKCVGQKIWDCAFDILLGGEDEPAATSASSVTATGELSGEFKGEQHSVTVSMTIPLDGGAVTGSFTGDCDGNIKGTFAGGDNGAISGDGGGKCAFVIPASGNFSGTVNKAAKTVNINGSGSALGITKSGSMTLTY